MSHLAHNGKLMACDILAVADSRPALAGAATTIAASTAGAALGAASAGSSAPGARGAATRCRVGVGEWSLGGPVEELLTGSWLSDHRPLSVSLELHDE